MADLEFVNPSTGAALGTHAFGTVAAGATSAAWAIRLRYKWGQSGSGLNQNALFLEVSTDGGATWQTDLYEFTLAVTAVVNVPADPLFVGTTTAARRVTRLDLPALRAGCAYDLELKFAPTLRTGAATTAYSWRLGVGYNEASQAISLNPDAPAGILTGLGDVTVSEWVTAPTLVNDTDKVTLGDCEYVHRGVAKTIAGGDVTLNQDDGSSATLGSGEEYIAVLSVGDAGTVTVTKGDLATAGSAEQPAMPDGELALAVVRVPYGGVIVTSTLLAVSGRCAVADTTGLVVSIQPGRAVYPGFLISPATAQTLTVEDGTVNSVYLSTSGVANLTEGVLLATVTAAAGDITDVTDARVLLYQGLRPILHANLDVNGNRITGVADWGATTDQYDAASVAGVWRLPQKTAVRVVAVADVATLSGEQTVDGYSLLNGHHVLLTNQTTGTENGIWRVGTPWVRAFDCDSVYNCYPGITTYVRFGTYTRQVWMQTAEMTDFTSDTQVWELFVDLDA
jgi:hypothetical protein